MKTAPIKKTSFFTTLLLSLLIAMTHLSPVFAEEPSPSDEEIQAGDDERAETEISSAETAVPEVSADLATEPAPKPQVAPAPDNSNLSDVGQPKPSQEKISSRSEPQEGSEHPLRRYIDVGAMVQTVFLYKSDDDFDATKPIYNEEGQSVGLVATIFQPQIAFHIGQSFELFYELELGLNMWSKNNPDQYDPTQNDTFFLKHREVWAAGSFLDDQLGFKVGYRHFKDPTGLFLNHWMGVASLFFLKHKGEHLWLSFGQVPDTTYEGFVITENNFVHDTFFFGAHRKNPITDRLAINASVYVLVDNHVVDRKLVLASPALGADITFGPHLLSVSAMIQAGTSEFSIPGETVKHFSHAIEAHGEFDFEFMGLSVNALYLSADDSYHRNDFMGSFYYSGKNRSATILLTENELRDFGDNYDEKMGTKDGGFYNLRSGIAVIDARLEGRIRDFFKPALIAGVGFATQTDNAMGEFYAGTELDLDLGFEWQDIVSFHLIGGVFLPGGAAAALVNDINRSPTDNVYMVQSSIQVTY